MKIDISPRGLMLMQNYIRDECGINIDDGKAYLIESRLSGMLRELNCTNYEQFYNLISTKGDRALTERIIDAITTNETLWFRDKTPWEIMEDIFLPKYVSMLKSGNKEKIRIWSSGCSTGQEPYSIAMSIHNFLMQRGLKDKLLSRFEILATDISGTVLEIAQNGKYDNISIIRGLPAEYRDKYFTNEGRVWRLDDDIIDMVTFEKFNLQRSFILLGRFDMIFCRYVMIYFSSEFKRDLASRFSEALDNEGVFFVGSSEVFENYREYFDRHEYKNGIYYQKKGANL
ncbi:MAG: protein-glutamate O-methyltransferase CheR [Clostridiales bacterium]|nr:protein-glutamate O-methyltransferase CheR [Clostridiales bacterium]